MAESWDLYRSLHNRFRALATKRVCSICLKKNRTWSRCEACGYDVCDRCSLETPDCPICLLHSLTKKYSVDWDFKQTFPKPCRHCFQPLGFDDGHESTCGFILKNCRACDKQLCAKDLLSHVRLSHARLLKKIRYHYDGQERILIMKPSVGFSYDFARSVDNQLFWETIEYDVEKQKCAVVVVWVPIGELGNVKFRVWVRIELRKSIVYLRGSGFHLESDGFGEQWMARFEIPTEMLQTKCDLLRRNAKIRLCIERVPSVRLSL